MSTTTTNFGLIKPELTDPADITTMNENWDKLDEEVENRKPFYVTLGGDADNGYTIDKTFDEIIAAYDEERQVILIEHSYGSIVEYKLQYVYDDQIDFSYHKALNNRVIEVYSWGTVTKKSYQYFSDINPPTCSTIGASPVGHTHTTIVNTTLTASGWVSSDSSAPYTQTLSITDISSTDTPFVDVVLSDDVDTAKSELEAWGFISKIETGDETITVTCFDDVPLIDLNIQVVNID